LTLLNCINHKYAIWFINNGVLEVLGYWITSYGELGYGNEPDFKFAKNIREHPRFKGHSFEANENIADVISSHDSDPGTTKRVTTMSTTLHRMTAVGIYVRIFVWMSVGGCAVEMSLLLPQAKKRNNSTKTARFFIVIFSTLL
jgi:hypothetical protein